jgi:hypothetical protein
LLMSRRPKNMTLSIAPNENTQPDFTVFYTALDGRKLRVGRIFHAPAALQGTPWFWARELHQRGKRPAPHRGQCEDLKPRRLLETLLALDRRADQPAAVAAVVLIKPGPMSASVRKRPIYCVAAK